MEFRLPSDSERRAERYAERADEARAQGKTNAADRLLLLAWAAYDDQDEALLAEDETPQQGEVCPLRRP
jgi:hypothetical protein